MFSLPLNRPIIVLLLFMWRCLTQCEHMRTMKRNCQGGKNIIAALLFSLGRRMSRVCLKRHSRMLPRALPLQVATLSCQIYVPPAHLCALRLPYSFYDFLLFRKKSFSNKIVLFFLYYHAALQLLCFPCRSSLLATICSEYLSFYRDAGTTTAAKNKTT